MRIRAIMRILGAFLSLFSFSMLPPVAVALFYADSSPIPFIIGWIISLAVGLSLWLPTKGKRIELKARDGFLIVVLFWVVLSLFAVVPFIIATSDHIKFLDALFISVSGFTTTGAGVLPSLHGLPHVLLYYRQQLQFFGGMGIIILAVAIMPIIGVGGMQLYRAEAAGPMKDNKLTPRIMQTAKIICLVYLSLFILCAFAYWLAGMAPFDAICEGFSTVSTGGFTIHDESFAFYKNPAIPIIGAIFMALAGINFSVHYVAIVRRRFAMYWHDIECRAFIFFVIIACGITIISLLVHNYYPAAEEAIINGLFNVISIFTTTGFTDQAYNYWPGCLPIMIMLFGVMGACGGSTTGGVKIMRVLLLQKQISREVKQLIHPEAVYPLKFGGNILPISIIESIWAFIAVYLGLYLLVIMLFMTTGLNFESAFGTAVASLSNVGAGVGSDPYSFAHLTPFAKGLFIFSMLAGRLEVFTLLVLFSPSFWRS
ncbi:MAG: potassium transporter [Gammaproteobacteria bacterium]|nr:potassium transporter [Gammaproteobacteria bacterium]